MDEKNKPAVRQMWYHTKVNSWESGYCTGILASTRMNYTNESTQAGFDAGYYDQKLSTLGGKV